ncbi:MAG: hypothetical protein EXR75_00990 [Myxococcales bacterium]|nr:hypothetical protein [Myxococcales bacterium]
MADPEQARVLLGKGETAMGGGDFEGARRFYAQAEALADEGVRQDLDLTRGRTDVAEATGLTEDLVLVAKKGKCKSAVDQTVKLIATRPELGNAIRNAMSKSINKCIENLEEDLATARQFVMSPEVALAMTERAYHATKKRVLAKVSEVIDELVGKLLEEREFEGARDAAAKLEKEGLVSPAEHAKLLTRMRQELAIAVGEHRDGVVDRGESADLERLDAWLALGWPKPSELPPAVVLQRADVALASVCEELECDAPITKKRWIFGHSTPRPLLDPKADGAGAQLKSGMPVWELAAGGGFSLVAIAEPGVLTGLASRARVAVGWVAENNLRDSDTSLLLPPGDSLIGVRVWGPLRKGDKLLELGTVLAVRRNGVVVRRLSDRVELELPRAVLHAGITRKGTKVIGFCEKPAAPEPVLIESVKESLHDQTGDPVATVRCLDKAGAATAMTKDAQLGSLRTRPEWLLERAAPAP